LITDNECIGLVFIYEVSLGSIRYTGSGNSDCNVEGAVVVL